MSIPFPNLVNGLVGAMQQALGVQGATTPAVHGLAQTSELPTGQYGLMRSLVSSNPYRNLADFLPSYGLENVSIQGLRNPTHAVCAVYRATMWPGTIRENDDESALPLVVRPDVANEENLRARVHDVWRYSNLDRIKSQVAFDLPLLGDQVFKVTGNPDKPHPQFQLVQPDLMTDLDLDSRGNLSYIRIDVPYIQRDEDGTLHRFVRTEIWDKPRGRYRRWVNQIAAFTLTAELGTPVEDVEIDQVYGTDFVPFVQMKFAESSASLRGVPAVLHALDKIIYGDALVTALHQRLTNHNLPDWVLSSIVATDAMGNPMPAPRLSSTSEVDVRGERIIALPSGWKIDPTVAQLDYANHLAVVNAHYDALAMTDLPELAWYRISDDVRLSGIALGFKLIPAKARIDEARGNAESALIQITQMALSIAQKLDLPGYSAADIGTYDNGDFDFWMADRDIIPMDDQTRAQIDLTKAQTVQANTGAGMDLEMALRLEGMTDQEIADVSQITQPVQP